MEARRTRGEPYISMCECGVDVRMNLSDDDQKQADNMMMVIMIMIVMMIMMCE